MALENSGAAAVLTGEEGAGGDDAAAAAAAAAAGGDQGGGDAGGGDGAQDPDWFGNLADKPGEGETASNRDYARAKGFKDLDSVLNSYRAAEKGLHDSGRVKVPGEGATDEDRAAFNKAIGVPDDVKGYEIKLPETNGGLKLDEGAIEKLAARALKEGTPKGAFEGIVNEYVESQIADHLAMVAIEDKAREDLFKEWGAAKAQHVAEANAAMRALGLTQADVAGIQAGLAAVAKANGTGEAGSRRTLELLQKIGGGMAEDVLLTGGRGRFGITPAEAQVRIDAIKADPALSAKVRVKDSAEQREWKMLLAAVGAAKEAAERES